MSFNQTINIVREDVSPGEKAEVKFGGAADVFANASCRLPPVGGGYPLVHSYWV